MNNNKVTYWNLLGQSALRRSTFELEFWQLVESHNLSGVELSHSLLHILSVGSEYELKDELKLVEEKFKESNE